MTFLRAILDLSRAWLLPTVWSNCLAGWWLGGGGHFDPAFWVLLGGTLIAAGGAFLNDAFDAGLDRQQAPGRPIPSGRISRRTAWRVGLALAIGGVLVLLWVRPGSGLLGLALACALVGYNALHRAVVAAPLVLGVARFMLYLLGAFVSVKSVTGWVVWCGIAVAAYSTGAGLFRETDRFAPGAANRHWPIWLLAVPIPLALVMNSGPHRQAALLLCAVLALWVTLSFRQGLWSDSRNAERTVSSLAIGVVLVDWLAVASGPRELNYLFVGFFLAGLGLRALAAAAPQPHLRAA